MEVDLPDNACLLDSLRKVAEDSSGSVAERLLAEDGTVQPGVMIFINDQPITGPAVASHSLSDGDTILLLPPISGG